MNIEKLSKQVETMNADIEKAATAEREARMALDAAIDLLADGGSDAKVETARRAHEKACDKYSALSRKRDRLQSEIQRLQADSDQQRKRARLNELVGSIEAARKRKAAIIGALKFEGANRNERIISMKSESASLSGELHTIEAEAETLSAELGENISATLARLQSVTTSDNDVREILLDYGVSDSWGKTSIEKSRDAAIPISPR